MFKKDRKRQTPEPSYQWHCDKVSLTFNNKTDAEHIFHSESKGCNRPTNTDCE